MDNEGCWVVRVVERAVVDAGLGEEGGPADQVGSADVGSWVVTHHEEAAITEALGHVVLDELEGQLLWFAEVKLPERELMDSAVLFQHVVERPEGQSRPMVSTSPDNIVLGSVVSGERKVPSLFFQENVVDDFECCFVGTDIVKREDRVNYLPPFVIIAGQGR